ncbi:hypothetical protein PIB30_036646 [Stylosanthes scabra]|uniref:Secreted protein n=1 Tax=Stylosanthes scabra TaxID=79078 RepID=A0ABU6UCT7_9FABA|nr:hypothetical protein [Stylosanthes scabra]
MSRWISYYPIIFLASLAEKQAAPRFISTSADKPRKATKKTSDSKTDRRVIRKPCSTPLSAASVSLFTSISATIMHTHLGNVRCDSIVESGSGYGVGNAASRNHSCDAFSGLHGRYLQL